jgi:hypothetical protein
VDPKIKQNWAQQAKYHMMEATLASYKRDRMIERELHRANVACLSSRIKDLETELGGLYEAAVEDLGFLNPEKEESVVLDFGPTTKDISNVGITTKEVPDFGITTKDISNVGITTKEVPDFGITTKEITDFGLSPLDSEAESQLVQFGIVYTPFDNRCISHDGMDHQPGTGKDPDCRSHPGEYIAVHG